MTDEMEDAPKKLRMPAAVEVADINNPPVEVFARRFFAEARGRWKTSRASRRPPGMHTKRTLQNDVAMYLILRLTTECSCMAHPNECGNVLRICGAENHVCVFVCVRIFVLCVCDETKANCVHVLICFVSFCSRNTYFCATTPTSRSSTSTAT